MTGSQYNTRDQHNNAYAKGNRQGEGQFFSWIKPRAYKTAYTGREYKGYKREYSDPARRVGGCGQYRRRDHRQNNHRQQGNGKTYKIKTVNTAARAL